MRASALLDLNDYLQRLPPWVKRFPVGSPAFLIAVRVIPGFGGTVATATAADFQVPVWVHVWTMCAIAVPICTVLTIFGDRVTVFVHGVRSATSIASITTARRTAVRTSVSARTKAPPAVRPSP